MSTEFKNNKRCEWGFHSYRHVGYEDVPYLGMPYEPFMVRHITRCKRCGIERQQAVTKESAHARVYLWNK